jgi:hypothetical protein
MPRSIIRTATTAIAIAALAAPTALARPADTAPAVEKATAAAQHKQDARSPDAIDAAAQHKQDARSPDAIDAATRTGVERPSAPSNSGPDTTPKAAADHGIGWTTIGLGIAGSLLAIGAITGVTSRTRRTARARIAA